MNSSSSLRSALPLILASTSPYRKDLLTKLGFPFQVKAPLFDEERYKGTLGSPLATAQFLARGKAESLQDPAACVIGSDQLVALGTEILGKPGTIERAADQLGRMSGKTHQLITAVALVYRGRRVEFVDVTKITLRQLSPAEIHEYVRLDQPLDCAGAYKIERNGIRLMEKIETQDFTAIQGLPLIELNLRLKELGWRSDGQK